MTDTPDSPLSVGDGLQPLSRDLVRVSGTLGEIATVWRRAQRCRLAPAQHRGLFLQRENLGAEIRVRVKPEPQYFLHVRHDEVV